MVCISQVPRSVAEFGQWDAWKGDWSAWAAGRDKDVSSHSCLGWRLWQGCVSSMASASTRCSWSLGSGSTTSSTVPLAQGGKYFLAVPHLWVSLLFPIWLCFSSISCVSNSLS